MKSRFTQVLFTGLFSAISLSSIASEAYVEDKSFNLENVKSLILKINHAEITLVQGKDKELKMTLSQELKQGDPDVCVHKINDVLKGGSLEVYTEASKRSNYSNCNIQRTVHIQLDQQTIQNLNVQHSHGAFSADPLTPGKLSLNISHSKLTLGNIASTTAKLKFDHTDTDIKTIASEELELEGAHGTTNINELSSKHLSIDRSHGKVEINLSKVDQLTARQSHSDLLLKSHQGKELNLHNAHGDITVVEGKAEIVEIKNSHGGIHYSGDSITLRSSNTHGSTNITQHNPRFKSIDSKVTHGSIELALQKNSLCELDGDNLKKVSAELFRKDDTCNDEKSAGLVKLRTTHGKVVINAL